MSRIYNIIVEIVICISAFLLFFGVFMNYYALDYQISLIIDNFKSAILYYPDLFHVIESIPIFSSNDIQTALTRANTNSPIIDARNKKIDNMHIIIICITFFLLLLMVIIPIIFGMVNVNYFTLIKHITITFILEFILIVVFELILILGIMPYFTSVRLFKVFEDNKVVGIAVQ